MPCCTTWWEAKAKICFSYWGGRVELLRGIFGMSSPSTKLLGRGTQLKFWEGLLLDRFWRAGVEFFNIRRGTKSLLWGRTNLYPSPSVKLLGGDASPPSLIEDRSTHVMSGITIYSLYLYVHVRSHIFNPRQLEKILWWKKSISKPRKITLY